jgi:hypothetical protein
VKPLPVLYSFARSGGTLVNQLLGVHPQCLVLSEVNPAASVKPVGEQAAEWLALLGPEEVAAFARLPYRRQVVELAQRAEQAGKRLVVRDWVTANFLAGTAGERVAPSFRLEQQLYLAAAGLELLPLVVTRRAGAVYASIVRSFVHLRELAIEDFAAAYLAYARAVRAYPRVHLEQLRAAPEAALEALMQAFDLDFRDTRPLLHLFGGYRNCTGNTMLENESSGARRILPPRPGSPERASHPSLLEADGLFGYE